MQRFELNFVLKSLTCERKKTLCKSGLPLSKGSLVEVNYTTDFIETKYGCGWWGFIQWGLGNALNLRFLSASFAPAFIALQSALYAVSGMPLTSITPKIRPSPTVLPTFSTWSLVMVVATFLNLGASVITWASPWDRISATPHMWQLAWFSHRIAVSAWCS